MGCSFLKISTSSYDTKPAKIIKKTVIFNPNPNKYEILKYAEVGNYLIVMLNYPDCLNYEGDKILVYKHCKIKDLLKQKSIDPHFSSSKKFYSPVARFEPTEWGWNTAVKMAISL